MQNFVQDNGHKTYHLSEIIIVSFFLKDDVSFLRIYGIPQYCGLNKMMK